MTASITTKRNKYYIVLSWNADGKRKQKWISTNLSISGNHKREVERLRVKTLEEWSTKISLNENDILFSEYLKLWLEDTKSTISQSTYHSYLQTVHNSICPYFEEQKIKLCDLKPYHIQNFYNQKMNTCKVTANTIHHYHANIHKALNYAVKTERITNNPADKIELPKKEKHIADFYTEDELKVLIEKCKGTQIEVVVLLAAWFGLRRGEIIGLKWNCIDFTNKTLSVMGTMKDKGEFGAKKRNTYYEPTAKTQSSIRTFPMSDWITEYLKNLKNEQDKRKKKRHFYNHQWDEFVCVRHTGDLIPLEYVSRAFPKLCIECGLRRITLHELRHSNISLLLDKGASMKELQEWAGHSSYNTTANIYSHIQSKSKLKMAQTLETLIC